MEVDEDVLARIYSFDLQFKGGKRTHFYRKLFGFKSKTTRENREGRSRVYENFYPGLLTPLPHLRLGKSVIAVPKSAEEEVDSFFEDPQWGPIDLHTFDGILPREDRLEAMEEALERIKVTRGESLRSEVDFLHTLERRGRLDSEDFQRIKRVVKKSEDLMSHDWTEGSEFSESLREEIKPLREEIE